MIKIKTGVQLHNLSPQIVLAIVVTQSIFSHYGKNLTITSGSESEHGFISLHYTGNAFDLRIRDITGVQSLWEELKSALTSDFDVILEKDHIHVEYQPRYRG